MLCKKPYMRGAIPCACLQCIPCRINVRRLWTHRIMLESFVSKSSSFLTLTYDDDHLPKDLSLDPVAVRNWLKRFRKELPVGSLRYLLVGEYGDKGSRQINPHYHLALFGFDCLFPVTTPDTGRRCFCPNCDLVRSTWKNGNIVIDELNRKSAQYIANYVTKKMTKVGDPRLEGRYPEFKRSSNKGAGGIGAAAVENIFKGIVSFDGEVYLSDRADVPAILTIEGKPMPLGRYLINKLRKKVFDENTLEALSQVRQQIYSEEMYSLWQNDLLAKKTEAVSVKQHYLEVNQGKFANVDARFELYQQKGSL